MLAAVVVAVFGPLKWGFAAPPAPASPPVSAQAILKQIGRYTKVQSVRLLAFISREDDRPWYVDDALLLVEFKSGKWAIAHAVRNPRFPKTSKQRGPGRWRFHDVCDAPWAGDQMYDHRPTRAEVQRFLKVTDWPAGDDKFWRVTKAYVDEDARKAGWIEPVSPLSVAPSSQRPK